MTAKSLAEQLDRIISMTQRGSIAWTEYDDSPGTFFVGTGMSRLTIDRNLEKDGTAVYDLTIRNQNGEPVESLHQKVKKEEDQQGKLPTLYRLALRSSLKIDQTLEDLERFLKKAEDEIPF